MEVRGQSVSVISSILLPHGDGNTDTSDPNIDILPHGALLGWKSLFIALRKRNSLCFVEERALLMMVGHGSVPTTLQLWPLPSLKREVSFLRFSPHLGSVDVYEPRPKHCSPPHKTNILEETNSSVNSIIAICTISLILVPVALFCFCSLDLLAVGCNSLDLLTPLTSFWNR